MQVYPESVDTLLQRRLWVLNGSVCMHPSMWHKAEGVCLIMYITATTPSSELIVASS